MVENGGAEKARPTVSTQHTHINDLEKMTLTFEFHIFSKDKLIQDHVQKMSEIFYHFFFA